MNPAVCTVTSAAYQNLGEKTPRFAAASRCGENGLSTSATRCADPASFSFSTPLLLS
jgi:hypothetical protein